VAGVKGEPSLAEEPVDEGDRRWMRSLIVSYGEPADGIGEVLDDSEGAAEQGYSHYSKSRAHP
jgi:hypothetical protein